MVIESRNIEFVDLQKLCKKCSNNWMESLEKRSRNPWITKEVHDIDEECYIFVQFFTLGTSFLSLCVAFVTVSYLFIA